MLSDHHRCWRQESFLGVHPTVTFISQCKSQVERRNPADVLPIRYKRSYQRTGHTLFLGNTVHHPTPLSWGTWFYLIPGKSLFHVFPVYDQPTLYCFLPGVLAVDSFSSWPLLGPICFPSHFCLLVRASKICFPIQDQQDHLDNLLCGRVTHCCRQVAWGCDTQDSPTSLLPSLGLSRTTGE